jgi:tetratricopeptide (TPR) repeat protein
VKPDRTDNLRRAFGLFFVFVPFLAFLLATGCLFLSPRDRSPTFALTDADARQAGALALYAKGLLIESGEGSDTNFSKEAAQLAFEQAVALDPDNRRPLTALLSNLADRGLYAEALAHAERYLVRHPDDLEIRFEAARSADAANWPAIAARHGAALLSAQPDNRELAQSLVRLYFQCGQETSALAALRALHAHFNDKASAALPVQWAVHYTREEALPARALACVRLALDLRTGTVERAALKTFAGECQLMLGQTNAAVATLFEAYRENPAFNTPLLRIGAVYASSPGSTNRLARQVREGRDPDTARLILAATQQALGDDAAAAATLREVYASRMRAGYFPDEGFYLWLGSLLEAQQAHGDAETLLRDALAAHPSSHEMKNFLAYMWAEAGTHLGEASRLASEALLAEPENPAYLDTMGWILYKAGRVYDALQLLLRAAETDRNEPVILDHVGDALLAAGHESEALAFWTRSYQFDPQPAVADKLRQHGVTPKPGETPNAERSTPTAPPDL